MEVHGQKLMLFSWPWHRKLWKPLIQTHCVKSTCKYLLQIHYKLQGQFEAHQRWSNVQFLTYRLSSVSLTIADAASVSGAPAVAAEMCECPWGYSGTSCEVSVSLKTVVLLLTCAACVARLLMFVCSQACLPDFYRVGGVMFGGNCMQCECNDHAKQCDIYGVCVVRLD